MFKPTDHAFVICAYGESPFLEECITSLKAQTRKATVLLATSTPNPHIKALCERYAIPCIPGKPGGGIAADWNHALSVAKTPLITIAHQDDTYEPAYLEEMLEMANGSQNPLLYFTNYGELRNGKRVDENRLLRIKRTMLSPLKKQRNRPSVFIRRRILSLGSPICCPSVTLIASRIRMPLFKSEFKSNLDWQTWAELAREQGEFLYNPHILMHHRIHEGSETTRIIEDEGREGEDLRMLQQFWPAPLAKLINKVYAKGQKSNRE
ncbi:glycosyl transferase family 2 [Gordonibacter sp. An232A]|nr:glycosyl transferase family 2 [Gordonibacter sp. An232A]